MSTEKGSTEKTETTKAMKDLFLIRKLLEKMKRKKPKAKS